MNSHHNDPVSSGAGLPYRSPWEAYPFLADPGADLRCDFELATDALSSLTGLLRGAVLERFPQQDSLAQELLMVDRLIYHCNPTLRTVMTVTQEEVDWLRQRTQALMEQNAPGGFVLPQGCKEACIAHLLRVKAKELVRLLYRHLEAGGAVPPLLLDCCNLLSGYFFGVALLLNRLQGVDEVAFQSRNYAAPDPN